MSADEDLQDMLDMLDSAPPQPEHGAGGAGQAFTAPTGSSSFAESSSGDPSDFEDLNRKLAEMQKAMMNLMTASMGKDQASLLLQKKRLEQDNLLKQLILQKNQNQVLNVNPYITQSQDRAVSQRRFVEAQKLKQDEFTRAEQLSIINNEQQYLTQQALANYKWGIPSVQGIVYDGGDYFTG